MDYLLFVLAIIALIAGFIGCIIPVLPGPIMSFTGILLLHFSKFGNIGKNILIILALLTITVTILDYFVPAWGTKKFGGSRFGSIGSIIGLIIGIFFLPAIGPFGIITILGGPFLGAFIGEKINGRDSGSALRSAFGSFIGFLAGTFMKFANCVIIAWFFIKELVQYFS